MAQPALYTLRDYIHWAYANLAMAHSALDKNQEKYSSVNFMIRSRLFKGLQSDSMKIRSFFYDEKYKIENAAYCQYCGSNMQLTIDHIIPKSKGGKDIGDNFLTVCKSCNSSKGNKDLMQWMNESNKFLPILVLRRYIKLIFQYSLDTDILDLNLNEISLLNLPFNFNDIPIVYPLPNELTL